MFTNNRKSYDLRSNDKTATQYQSALPQKGPVRKSNSSSYKAVQDTGLVSSIPYTGSGYSTLTVGLGGSNPHTGPTNPTISASPKYSRPLQDAVPANSKSYGYSGQNFVPRFMPHNDQPWQKDNSNNSPDQLVADLICQFSQTQIDQRTSIEECRSTPVSAPHDAISKVVQEVLTRDLKIVGDGKLLPTDPIFDLARQFAQRWNISDEAVDSHIRLACGYLKFPVILLLNPAPRHESLPFNQMVDECKTLRWIEEVLFGIGLDLKDVIILDACTLLSSDRIKELGKQGGQRKKQAMAEAYDVTQEMLRRIQPNIILSCQCSTNFSTWSAGGHIIAKQLCSSLKTAKNREVKRVYLNNSSVNVIHAYHPSGFLNNKGNRGAHFDTFGNFLKSVFQTVYFPCANWKSKHLMDVLALSNNNKYIKKAANTSTGKETKNLSISIIQRQPANRFLIPSASA